MDPWAQVDAYCERLAPGLWAEPLNAVTNLAFLVAALVMWRRLGSDRTPLAKAMVATLASVGIASGAWHSFAYAWTGAADSLTILIFILIYLYASNRHFWGMPAAWAVAGTLAFFPFAAATVWILSHLPFVGISAAYWSVALLIGGTAAALWHRHPATARDLGWGAALLSLSITARSLDDSLCPALPIGTHFIWHLLNAVLLGWMIEVYRRHLRSGAGDDVNASGAAA